jgi:hypothetical protein
MKEMSKDEEKQYQATLFVNSMRGKYIISQALCIAIKQMNKVKGVHREESNIADMEYLRDNVFPIFKVVDSIEERAKKFLAKKRKNGEKRTN